MRGEVKERRILLRYCSGVNARAAEERIVTPDNIDYFSKRYPDQKFRLYQWIPFEAPNTNIDTYIKRGGYKALEKALRMKPEKIISEIKESGLIGRGGAAFPTGLKWEFAFKQAEKKKYFVCNADEGEPGTFKDKVLLDQDPHKVIEGMIIGAYAINFSKGYIYIRGEYPDSAKVIKKAVEGARDKNILGDNILGSSFSFDIKIRTGAGAYIVGEETALFRSIEGKRGIPEAKPPFPTVSGLYKKPTVINNVETIANIPYIILDGVRWFRSLGVEGSFGTKLFSISGNVKNPGVYEVELGKYTLGDLIYELAEGIEENRKLKAVLPGGASTRFLTEDKLDIRMDYRSLKETGSSLGTGAIIVFDEAENIPEIVRDFFDFYEEESCGNCVPCRIGTKRISEMLQWITEPVNLDQLKYLDTGGPKEMAYLKKLQDIGVVMKDASKCGLGQTAPDPLLSSIELFKNEYRILIEQRQKEYEYFAERTRPLAKIDEKSG